MCEVKLGFDPESLGDDVDGRQLRQLFKIGGVVLRFWALYRQEHITSQLFVPGLIDLHERIEARCDEGEPPYDLDWFCRNATACLTDTGGLRQMTDWIAKRWDYFNPNVQRKVTFVFDRVEPTEKRMLA